ncbi:Hsp20/alpha crystallin family protein [Sphingomonas sp. MS122]|uniref:Hsp20/alpha crystallin family protein n=1 Tax=Sphingomonas sp. MS122 TaxID=3412683 RepID=UPI003C307DD5
MNDISPVNGNRPVASETPFGWLRHEIDRLFDDIGRPARESVRSFAGFGPRPAVELIERDKDYRLTVELPGVKEDDVEVSLADGILTLKGDKREHEERKEGGFMLSERRYGAFERQIRLPADADPDEIEAKFKKGVLTLTIAKDEEKAPQPRKITVNAE